MKTNSVAVSLATASLFLGGCDKSAPETFTSTDLANARLPAVISKKTPAFVMMNDGNLLCICQEGEKIHLYKTSSGYAEGGGALDIHVAGVATDFSNGNVYTKINRLEALAYFNNDWNKIYKEVLRMQKADSSTVEPYVVKNALEILVTPLPSGLSKVTVDDRGAREYKVIYNPFMMPQGIEYYSVSVFINLGAHGMLRISEREGEVKFYKTSSGYAVSGGKAHVFGVGVGAESSSGNQYNEISMGEVMAYLDNDSNKVLAAVRKQFEIIKDSVPPELVERAFNSRLLKGTPFDFRIVKP